MAKENKRNIKKLHKLEAVLILLSCLTMTKSNVYAKCMLIACPSGTAHSYAIKLTQEEKEAEELGREKLEQYEMNHILEMLGLKKWIANPFVDLDVQHEDSPLDEPMGKYSKEALSEYLSGDIEIEVEIEYYFGDYAIVLPETDDKVSIQVIKIYENGELKLLGRAKGINSDAYGRYIVLRECYEPNNIEIREIPKRYIEELETPPTDTETEKLINMTRFLRSHCKKQDALEEKELNDIMKIFMTMKNARGLYKLSTLPLTESFFEQCMTDFPYIDIATRTVKFYPDIYGIGDNGKLFYICKLKPAADKIGNEYIYYIEMQLKDEKIDNMDIRLIWWDMPGDPPDR